MSESTMKGDEGVDHGICVGKGMHYVRRMGRGCNYKVKKTKLKDELTNTEPFQPVRPESLPSCVAFHVDWFFSILLHKH